VDILTATLTFVSVLFRSNFLQHLLSHYGNSCHFGPGFTWAESGMSFRL
jgi:hypothetical protein